MVNKKTLTDIQKDIIEIANKELTFKEAVFIKHNIERKKYNVVRAYMETCVMSVQRKLLDSIVESEYDPTYGSRYKTVKKIDNLITYICEEIKNDKE